MALTLDNTNPGNLTLQTPLSGTYSLRFPDSDGDPNQVLQTDGSGNLQWATVSGAGPFGQTLWVPAPALTARTTSGAAAGSTETTTNKVMVETYDFDQAADEFVQFSVSFPKGWNLGTVTAEFFWTADSGSGSVAWDLQAVALSNDDVLDTAFGTEQNATDTLLATGDVHRSPVTPAITIAGTPAEGDLIVFQLFRDTSDDSLSADARLIGIKLFYTATTLDDV